MNIQQFAALKKGDIVTNGMSGGVGTVDRVSDSGVSVRWGASDMLFFYSVNSTAWMHWTVGDASKDDDA